MPLGELLPQVNVLALHCPLAENTRNLIGAEELASMKADAMLINTARGGIVDDGGCPNTGVSTVAPLPTC